MLEGKRGYKETFKGVNFLKELQLEFQVALRFNKGKLETLFWSLNMEDKEIFSDNRNT